MYPKLKYNKTASLLVEKLRNDIKVYKRLYPNDEKRLQGDTQITTPTPTFVKSLSHLSKLLAIYMKNSKK